jgi:hypothetical protein
MGFLRLPGRKDNAGNGGARLAGCAAAVRLFGIMHPDSRLAGLTGTIPGVVVPASTATLFFFGYSSISPPRLPVVHTESRITSGQGSISCGEGAFSPVPWEICSTVSTAHLPIS